jgi:hypothetical protein
MGNTTGTVMPTSQVLWLIVYWWSLLVNLYLLASALLRPDETEVYQVVVLLLAGAAVVLGSTFATRIARRRVSNVTFIKGTTTIRVIAIAWLMLGVVLIAIPIIEVLINIDTGGKALAGGLLGTVGSISFLGMVGPGYSEYREAMSSPRPD